MKETQSPLFATEGEIGLLNMLVTLAKNVELLILERGQVRSAKSAKR